MIAKMSLNMLSKAFEDLEIKAKENNMSINEFYQQSGGSDDFLSEVEDFGNSISRLPEDMEGRNI